MNDSQYIYKDQERNEKCRLVQQDEDWFVCECKPLDDEAAQWIPFIFGTSEFLQLTEQDKKWAIKK